MLDATWSGEYWFLDEPVHALKPKHRAQLNKEHIGFVFQQYHLIDTLTVYENIETPLTYRDYSRGERQAMVADILDRFQIVGKKDLFPSQLSGGQQQLVGVARAVVAKPKLILADEPTGNLHSAAGSRDHGALHPAQPRRHHHHPGHPLRRERPLQPPHRPAQGRLGRRTR